MHAHVERTREMPRINWFWGLLMAAIVTFFGIFLPASLFLLLGAEPEWAAASLALVFLLVWMTFIGVFRIGQQREWW